MATSSGVSQQVSSPTSTVIGPDPYNPISVPVIPGIEHKYHDHDYHQHQHHQHHPPKQYVQVVQAAQAAQLGEPSHPDMAWTPENQPMFMFSPLPASLEHQINDYGLPDSASPDLLGQYLATVHRYAHQSSMAHPIQVKSVFPGKSVNQLGQTTHPKNWTQ